MRSKIALLFFVGLFVNGLFIAPYIRDTNETGAFDGLGLWVAIAHGLGGALAGWLMAGSFGRAGIGGWIISLFAVITIILLGGLAGGVMIAVQGMITAGDTVLQAGIRGIIGALAAPVAMANLPGLWLLPPVLTVLAHLLAQRQTASPE
ncbi:MAG: hypothetical protein HRU32_06850 [Rhodobacteraceae bacterium]|nr:hypothetical protein [Paracoccaceae bacterium]